MMAATPWIGVPSKVSIDGSRFEEKRSGRERERSGIERSISAVVHRHEMMIINATYVERSEIRTVRVECLIVEVCELLSDSVDVCHGFSIGGGVRKSRRWRWRQQLCASD
jgi:hypothetical protein